MATEQLGRKMGELALVNVEQLVEVLTEHLTKSVHFAITFENGEPTISFDFPDCAPADYETKLKHAYATAYSLLDQAATHRGRYAKPAEQCQDVNIR